MDCYGIIYCGLNIANNKRYIGQTIRSLDRRKKEHISLAKNNSSYAFHKAIQKYGEEVFEWSIIDVADNQEELDDKELYWINYYNTYNGNGYNMSVGGQKSKRTEDNADDVSMMFGGKEFLVFDLEGSFMESRYSQTEYAKELGVSVTTVNNVLLGIKNSTRERILIYKNEYSDEKLKNLVKKIYERRRCIWVFDKDDAFVGKWNNKTQCADELNVARNTVLNQLKTLKQKPRGYYKFFYVENLPLYLKEKIEDVI